MSPPSRGGRALLALFLALVTIACAGLPAAAEVPAGRRVALVIGNGAYQHVDRLTNPEHDAALIAETLRGAGFELVGGGARTELDRAAFNQAVHDFGVALQGAEVALFYYSGHGMQVSGENWLVPVDANPTRPQDLDFQMVDAGLVLRQMEGAGTRLNLVILDACRNNPFASRGVRGTQSGLAEMHAPEGTLISYATQPGNVAADGTGQDSPYSAALAEAIRRPGLDMFQVFNQVGLSVKQATAGTQQPWLASSPLSGNFYFFNGPTTIAVPPAAPAAPAVPSISEDALFWQSVAGSSDADDFAAYLKSFPNGRFAELAQRRLAALRTPAVAPPPPLPAAPAGPRPPDLMLGATLAEALPQNRFPYSALNVALEYRHQEVRYLVVPLRELPRWRAFLADAGCLSPESYIAFLFRNRILFRASVRLHRDESCDDYARAVEKLKTVPHEPDIKTAESSAHGFTVFDFIKPGIADSDGDLWR